MSEHTVLAQESVESTAEPQQNQVQETTGLQDEGLCKVCLEKTSCVLFLPCAHLVTCMDWRTCFAQMSRVPSIHTWNCESLQ
ncbi:baculoviral IAP repeat-containing protein 8-like isoform X4 [Haliotis rubra]|uniref:baculoviral IAP repeat-containing protein 8-like isoform X4 n=1 Tax=Haliotis rubra TaxID=36100 RepID=UPI001EE6356F|nr:baculoviral IAP repeat-containing protein 8-like isoform X4 [Haliotis rubra]